MMSGDSEDKESDNRETVETKAKKPRKSIKQQPDVGGFQLQPANSLSDIIDSYDQVASNYASKFLKELERKPLDQLLLKDFASAQGQKGKLVDFGCGPGQTTRFLSEHGAVDVLGVDISPAMISEARVHHPNKHENKSIDFDVADMLKLQYENNHFSGAIAFYSIVIFNYEQVAIAFREIYRVLQPGSHFLFSFHVGDQVVHLNEFLEKSVNILRS
jgi:ubiquinone/menaquinone biosynthesis C-methylase UbiE